MNNAYQLTAVAPLSRRGIFAMANLHSAGEGDHGPSRPAKPTNLVTLRPGKPTYLHGLSCAGAVGGGWGGGGDLYGTRSPLPLVVDQCALGCCCGLLGLDEGLRWSTAPP